MWRLLVVCSLPLIVFADSRWIQFSSGPFEVFTDAGVREGRETLVRFEQLRYAFGQTIGIQNPQTALPVRILLFKTAKEINAHAPPGSVVQGRDRFAIVLLAGAPVPPQVIRECTRVILESSSERMPAAIEHGLIDLFSTIEVTGIRISLGKPLPPASRNKDWARVELLATDQEYYGKLRVLLSNLRRGLDDDPAYRNAFGKSPAQIEQETERYLAAGNFQPVSVSARPMSVERDFPEKPVDPAAIRLALADLLLGERSRAAYESMIREKTHLAEAYEGLGRLALSEKQLDAAQSYFLKAMEAGAQTAGTYLEYARLEPDSTKATAALERAAKLNPKMAEPRFLLAGHESDPKRKIEHLKAAASLSGRNALYWQALAEAYLSEKDFPEAAKAWRAAEQASTTAADRDRMRQARLSIEQQRLDYEAAERKRKAEQEAQAIRKLKDAALAELRAIEAKANAKNGSEPSDEKIVPWWEGPQQPAGKSRGTLKRVDCLGKQARLVVEGEDHKLTKLLVRDPSQVAIVGGGEQKLGCGPQTSRNVIVEYFPKKNLKLATVGEVATIEFQ